MNESEIKYVLLDFDNKPIRYFNHPAPGTVPIEIKKPTYSELLNEIGECLL